MKRAISFLLTLLMLCSITIAAFAEESDILTMEMGRNGRTVYYEDGSRAPNYVKEKVEREFHRLRNGQGVNWDLFDYEEMTFRVEKDGSLTALTQYLISNTGDKIESSDPQVVFLDSPDSFHATGAGKAEVKMTSEAGEEAVISYVEVVGESFSSFTLTNKCGKCEEAQGEALHCMSCGHYACEVEREAHGDAPCGVTGHFNCDDTDHSLCGNCLKPVCDGREHGAGKCVHVHSYVHVSYSYRSSGELVRCPGCGQMALFSLPEEYWEKN